MLSAKITILRFLGNRVFNWLERKYTRNQLMTGRLKVL